MRGVGGEQPFRGEVRMGIWGGYVIEDKPCGEGQRGAEGAGGRMVVDVEAEH